MSAQTQQIRAKYDEKHPSISPDIILKLEHAYAMDCTDKEACLFAGTTLSTLYAYQRDNPEFGERKEILKQNPILKARTRVVTAVETDTSAAQWYLERKQRDEFGRQVDVNVNETRHLTVAQIDLQISELVKLLGYERPQDAEVIDAEMVQEDSGDATN